jgi:hypothetical protein
MENAMTSKISPRHIFLKLSCLAALLLSACSSIGQVIPLISPLTRSTGNQGLDPTLVYNQPGEATSQSSGPASPGSATAAPMIAPTPTLIPTTIPNLVQPTVDPVAETNLKNATFSIKDFASVNGGSDTFTLVDGKYAYIDPTNPPDPANYTVQYQKSATGDLNGDGVPDAAVILIADTSGSGAFIYLAAMVADNNGLENSDTIYLGDRVIVESMAIQDGMVQLQMITHGPQDGLCCPSVKTSQTYLFDNGHLVIQVDKTVARLAREVVQALKTEDMTRLATFIEPNAEVRFSPYANVKDSDLVFTPDQLVKAFNDPAVYLWGSFEGSGAPIQLTFADYYTRFVYSQDFASATQVGYNHSLSSASVIDNSYDFYPNSIIVEYYLPGANPDYGAGLDWQSLKLVFQQIAPIGSNPDGQWYLVGIIHSQWTI